MSHLIKFRIKTHTQSAQKWMKNIPPVISRSSNVDPKTLWT